MRHHRKIEKNNETKESNSNFCCRCVADHKGSCWLAFATKNTTNFEVFGASQAKNHGTVTVVVVGGGVAGVVVVAGVGVGVVVVTPAVFFCLVVAENRQIGCVFASVWDSWSKEHRKYQYLLRLGSPKPRYLWCCFFCQQKPRYLQCFLDSSEQKHWYLRSFRHVARSVFSMKKVTKTM